MLKKLEHKTKSCFISKSLSPDFRCNNHTNVSVSVSVLTLTFISVDRWYAICHPLAFRSTSSRARKAIVLIWLASLLLVLPYALHLDTNPFDYTRVGFESPYFTTCTHTWSDTTMFVHQLLIGVFLYLGPFVLMSFFYYQIVRVLWDDNIPGSSETAAANTRNVRTAVMKTSGNGAVSMTSANPSSGHSAIQSQIRSRRKAAKMIISVVVLFGLCYLPVHLLNTLKYSQSLPETTEATVVALITHWLCYANSAVNPIIYNFMNGKFRREFRKSFCCLCKTELDTQTPTVVTHTVNGL